MRKVHGILILRDALGNEMAWLTRYGYLFPSFAEAREAFWIARAEARKLEAQAHEMNRPAFAA